MTATYHDTVFKLAKGMKMTALEDQQHIVNLLEDALARVSEATRIEQRLTHQPHTNTQLRDIQNRLEWQLDTERAMLKRLQTVGR